jgi:superfamily II DNA or RNA helicase
MKFNILVTTYEFVMFDRSKLSKIDWKYIIIDEAQRMKDRDSVLARDLDRYRCQRRLLLTGTPLQVINQINVYCYCCHYNFAIMIVFFREDKSPSSFFASAAILSCH